MKRRDLIVATVGLLLGIGAAVVVPRLSGETSSIDNLASLAGGTQPVSPIVRTDVTLPPASVGTPQAAVEDFLGAEQSGDLASSYTYLSEADRASLTTLADWEEVHADLLPPVLSYSVIGVESQTSPATITTTVHLQPNLDAVLGLTPGVAEIDWKVVNEAGGWYVLLEESTFTPRYPDDGGAAVVAEKWAQARQDCSIAFEHVEGIIGPLDAGDELCGAAGQVRVGEPSLFEDPVDAAPFVDAYGPEFENWARVVPVVSPVPLRTVLAPIGNEWVVIGVLGGGG